MRKLTVKVRPMNNEVMSELEQRGLVRRFAPTTELLETPEGMVKAEATYVADQKFGAHMLICVAFNRSEVQLATHHNNEEFLLVNEGREQKPLILVVGMHRESEFQELVSSGQLTTDDVWAIELKFNDPSLSFFTMNAMTPHCEWTVPGPEPANIFYVTEPSATGIHPIDMGDYAVEVAYESGGVQ